MTPATTTISVAHPRPATTDTATMALLVPESDPDDCSEAISGWEKLIMLGSYNSTDPLHVPLSRLLNQFSRKSVSKSI